MSKKQQKKERSLEGSPEQTAFFRDQYKLYHVQLTRGEQILAVTSDHFMEWLPRVLPPLGLSLFCLAVVFIRSTGARFFGMGPPPLSPIDLVNVLLFALLLIIVLIWLLQPKLFSRQNQSKPSGVLSRILLIIGGLATIAAIIFRIQGGRIVYMDPTVSLSVDTFFFDPVNWVFLIIAVLSLIAAAYIFVESENDHLILTTDRVILSDREVVGKYQIDQINIPDVQDVLTKPEGYLQHWLNYGNITVQSVRKKLYFKGAENPAEIQAYVMDLVNAFRSSRKDKDFREIVDTKVYGKPATPPPQEAEIHISTVPALLRWVLPLPENPEIDLEKKTMTWRKHWLFGIGAVVKPFLFGIPLILLVAFLGQIGTISGTWMLVLILLTLVSCGGWAWWRFVDYENDLYILGPNNITDIEALPFGPVEKRNASLGAIQNVTSKTTLISRIFNYGDVFLETAGRGEFTFPRVPYPNEVVRTINDYQDEFRRGDRKRNMEDMATLLKYYHDEQLRRGELLNEERLSAASAEDL